MNRLLVDTNVVLDLLARREPFYESASKLMSLSESGKVMLFVNSVTMLNTDYVLKKICGASESRLIMRRFRLLVGVLSLTDRIVDLALNDDLFTDFEDAVQYHSAIENQIDGIITRDLKDFRLSRIPIMTAQDFLNI